MAEEQVEFLKEYNAWIEQRKRQSRDLTPEAFIVDRAKDEALDRLIEIDVVLGDYEVDSATEPDDMPLHALKAIRKIVDILDDDVR